MTNIVRVLVAGAGVWLLSTMLAFASCGGLLGDGLGLDENGESRGVLSVLAPARSLLRTAGNAIAELESAGSAGGGLSSLLQDASAIVALSDVGILKSASGASVAATVALARALLTSGKKSAAAPSLSPTDLIERESEQKRAKRRRRPTEEIKGASTKLPSAPKDLLYTHQQCYIGADEAEVSGQEEKGGALPNRNHIGAEQHIRTP